MIILVSVFELKCGISTAPKKFRLQNHFFAVTCAHLILAQKKFSSRNVKLHFGFNQAILNSQITRIQAQNATDEIIENNIYRARNQNKKIKSKANIEKFLQPPGASSKGLTRLVSSNGVETPSKDMQEVIPVLFSCECELPLSKIVSLLFQSLIDMFGVHAQFSRKDGITQSLIPIYQDVCRLLKRSINSVKTGRITLEGWSAALDSPILGMTWHFTDDAWRLQKVPVCALKTGTDSKTGEKLW